MNQKKCLKCGHVASYEGPQPDACPGCGAIYRKVEEVAAAAQNGHTPKTTRNSGFSPSVLPTRPTQKARSPQDDLEWFVSEMRSNSLYPTWRELVKWATWFGYAMAIIVLIGAAIGFKNGQIGAAAVGVGVALLIAVVARVSRELSLMMADLADAAVRQAASSGTRA